MRPRVQSTQQTFFLIGRRWGQGGWGTGLVSLPVLRSSDGSSGEVGEIGAKKQDRKDHTHTWTPIGVHMHAHTRNHPYLLKGRAGLPVRGQMSIWGTQATWPPLLCARISDQHEVLSGGPVASVLCHHLTLESARVKAGSSPTPTQELIRCSHSFSDEETEPQREASSRANVTAIPEKRPPCSCNRSLPVRCLPRPSPPAPTPRSVSPSEQPWRIQLGILSTAPGPSVATGTKLSFGPWQAAHPPRHSKLGPHGCYRKLPSKRAPGAMRAQDRLRQEAARLDAAASFPTPRTNCIICAQAGFSSFPN